MLFVINPISHDFLPIGAIQNSHPVLLIVLEVSFVDAPIRPEELAVAVHLVLNPIAFVASLIAPEVVA